MSRFEERITVDVPVRTAYDQWTQFEEFPTFMEGVERVQQLDDKNLHWTANVAGKTKQWTAEITDQTPDVRVAWKSIDGAENGGAVLFRQIGPSQTEVTLRIDAEPEGVVESAGDALGFLQRRVKGDLERFKERIEAQGVATDGWRGEIHGDEVRPDPSESTTTGTSGIRR
jgi:uncharacterized membrane protein